MKPELKWADVPSKWHLCFNRECPLRETCLRWQAGQLSPSDLTFTRCITPNALIDGTCRHFASAQPVSFALGFTTIYSKVLKKDFTVMRKQMTNMLSGKRYYYEYMRGERPLKPYQQEMIRRLFEHYGYADCVHFDKFEEGYYFPPA
ncbi:MAG: hypothetical protein IJT98_03355 [Prevotella sp.]|nr:hypothetical protein [Prevotella sp.]